MKPDRDSRIEARQLRAVQKTDDDKRLFRIWKKSPYVEVRAAAVYKLKKQDALEYIARNERMDELRCEAVKKLEDKALLIKIAKGDDSEHARFIGQKKLEYADSEYLDTREEIDADTIRALRMIYEHEAYLRCLATGEEESEALW